MNDIYHRDEMRTMRFLPGTKQSNILPARGNVGQHLCVNAIELHRFATLSIN